MEVRVSIFDPAGNTTALVETPVAASDRQVIAEELMLYKDMGIEQVGFITEPKGDGVVRIEMMGGEFCGNATRCGAFWWASRHSEHKQCIVPVEISGCEQCIACSVDLRKKEVRAAMPIPANHYTARIDDRPAYICNFGGIVHFVLPNEFPDQDIIDDMLQYAVVNFRTGAIGLIFLSDDGVNLCPVVYVPQVGSLIFEKSCASGTAAAALYIASKKPNGRFHWDFYQPGGRLAVDLVKRDSKVEQLKLGGIIRELPSTLLFLSDGCIVNENHEMAEIRNINDNTYDQSRE